VRAPLPTIGFCIVAVALVAGAVARAAPLTTTSAQLLARTVVGAVPISTCTLAPNADTYADAGAPLTAQGSATTLHVRSQLVLNKRTYLRFDVASCSIPAVARLKTSSLNLVVTTAPASSRTYDIHSVTAAWTEAALTWLAQPAVAGAATASVATGTTGGATLTTDVMADVSTYVTGAATNNGWRVKDRTEDAVSSVETQFGARENGTAAQRPTLVVTYYP
jgi:hypothetical protein